ncbi:MAG: hypothetical protein ACOYK8_05715 [Alphaproteobacteria bacterium]
MVRYGIEEHKHHGHVCALYLQVEQAKSHLPPSALLFNFISIHAIFAVLLLKPFLIYSKIYLANSVRAPPFFF